MWKSQCVLLCILCISNECNCFFTIISIDSDIINLYTQKKGKQIMLFIIVYHSFNIQFFWCLYIPSIFCSIVVNFPNWERRSIIIVGVNLFVSQYVLLIDSDIICVLRKRRKWIMFFIIVYNSFNVHFFWCLYIPSIFCSISVNFPNWKRRNNIIVGVNLKKTISSSKSIVQAIHDVMI